MNMRKLSINKACVRLGTLLLLAVGAVCTAVYLLTRNITAVRCVFLFSLFVLLCVIFFVALIRRKLVRFSDAFCGQMDGMLSGDKMCIRDRYFYCPGPDPSGDLRRGGDQFRGETVHQVLYRRVYGGGRDLSLIHI